MLFGTCAGEQSVLDIFTTAQPLDMNLRVQVDVEPPA